MRIPAIVAELSGNHRGSEEHANDLIRAAAQCGADAVKLQTFEPKLLVGNARLVVEAGPWAGRNLVELYQKTWTPKTWHKGLFAAAHKQGLEIFSSPFSREDVDFLEGLDCSRYKIPSFEILDLDLIRYAAQTGKPLVMSTGMASLSEIEEAVEEASAAGCKDLTLLQCTSGYPAPIEEANLACLQDLQEYFGHDYSETKIKVGLSDHTLGVVAAVAAVALGAVMIEKHLQAPAIAQDVDEDNPDEEFSASPQLFMTMVSMARDAARALGAVHYGPTASEAPHLALRRALWVVKDVKPGEALTRDNLRSCRPSLGAPHYPLAAYIGKRAKEVIRAGTLFNPDWAEA